MSRSRRVSPTCTAQSVASPSADTTRTAPAHPADTYDSVDPDDEPEAALDKIETIVRDAVLTALERADSLGLTPLEAALRQARDYLAGATGAADEVLDALVPT